MLAASLLCAGAPPLLSARTGEARSQEPVVAVTWEAKPGLEDTARGLITRTESILAEARDWTGLLEGPPDLHLVVLADRDDLSEALGEKAPDWYAAVAFPFQRRLILATEISGSKDRLHATLRHELLHAWMAALGEKAFVDLPAWFHEGLAEAFAGDIYLGGQGVSLAWRAFVGELEPLRDYRDGFGVVPYSAAIGYALGHAFVDRLIRLHGAEVIPALLERIADGESLDSALVAVTGKSVITHEEELRDELASIWAVLGDFYPQLFLGIMLLVIAGIPFALSRRRQRRLEFEERWEWQDRVAAAAANPEPQAEDIHPEAEPWDEEVEDSW